MGDTRDVGASPGRVGSRWSGLRGRAVLAFAALTLVLSVVVAAGVWLTVSQFLLGQREKATVSQTVTNAEQVQASLRGGELQPPEALAELGREIGSTSLLARNGEWFTTSLQVGRDDLPGPLREAVVEGQSSRQRIDVGGRTMMVVGVPLVGLGQAYFEVFSLDELHRTLRVLSLVLVAAATALPLASLVLGWWVTRPVFRPLTRVADAAAAVAAGDLDARIDPGEDPALGPIADSFNRTADALQRRVRADARFAADVSHELRTPLTTMLSAVALVDAYRDVLPEDGREALELLDAEVTRFTRLVQDLLEISRTDAGSTTLHVTEIRVADVVHWAVPSPLRRRVVVEPDAATATVRSDKRRLEQIIANLVSNAERHGEGLQAVTVSCTGDIARVVVDDAGPGVAEGERERIFEPFARGRGTDRASGDGAGLGLALVARHARLLGCEVQVEDNPHGGARFVLTMPMAGQPRQVQR